MKKTIKLALVLSTIALLSVSCSVQTYSLVGTYDNGKKEETTQLLMTVYDNGLLSFRPEFSLFNYNGGTPTVNTPSTVEESLRCISGSTLIPWDLASSKIEQKYDIKANFQYGVVTSIGGSGGSSTTTEYVPVDLKLSFAQDGDNIKCDIELSGVPEGKGMNGKVTVTKKVK